MELSGKSCHYSHNILHYSSWISIYMNIYLQNYDILLLARHVDREVCDMSVYLYKSDIFSSTTCIDNTKIFKLVAT